MRYVKHNDVQETELAPLLAASPVPYAYSVLSANLDVERAMKASGTKLPPVSRTSAVKAELVRCAEDYRWSGAGKWDKSAETSLGAAATSGCATTGSPESS